MMRWLRKFRNEQRGDVIQWVAVTVAVLTFTFFVLSLMIDKDDPDNLGRTLVKWVKNQVSCMATGKDVDGNACGGGDAAPAAVPEGANGEG